MRPRSSRSSKSSRRRKSSDDDEDRAKGERKVELKKPAATRQTLSRLILGVLLALILSELLSCGRKALAGAEQKASQSSSTLVIVNPSEPHLYLYASSGLPVEQDDRASRVAVEEQSNESDLDQQPLEEESDEQQQPVEQQPQQVQSQQTQQSVGWCSSSSSSSGSSNDEPSNGTVGDNQDNQAVAANCLERNNIVPWLLLRLLIYSLYGVIFAFGLIGNTLTLYAVRKKREKFSIIDLFIANLAFGDIMFATFAVPITPIADLYYGHWGNFHPSLCHIFSFAQSSSVYISTFTMINIAYVRYKLIVHPLRGPMSRLAATLMNLSTWLIAILVTVPYLMHVEITPDDCGLKFCTESWQSEHDKFLFSIFSLTLQFFIPFLTVSFFYGKIFHKLRQQNKLRQLNRQQRANQDRRPTSSVYQLNAARELFPSSSTAGAHSHHSQHPLQHQRRSSAGEQHLSTLIEAQASSSTPLVTLAAQPASSAEQLLEQSTKQRSEQLQTDTCKRAESSLNGSIMIEESRLVQVRSCQLLSEQHPHHQQHPQRQHLQLELSESLEPASRSTITQRSTQLQQAGRDGKRREKDRRSHQTNRKLLFMVVLFAISWLPLNVYNLTEDFFPLVACWQLWPATFLLVHLIACSSVCFNPILYAWMSDNYNQELRDVLPGFLLRSWALLATR